MAQRSDLGGSESGAGSALWPMPAFPALESLLWFARMVGGNPFRSYSCSGKVEGVLNLGWPIPPGFKMEKYSCPEPPQQFPTRMVGPGWASGLLHVGDKALVFSDSWGAQSLRRRP